MRQSHSKVLAFPSQTFYFSLASSINIKRLSRNFNLLIFSSILTVHSPAKKQYFSTCDMNNTACCLYDTRSIRFLATPHA